MITRKSFFKKSGLIGLTGVLMPNKLFQKNKESVDCKIKELRRGRNIIHRIIVAGDGHWYDKHIDSDNPRQGKWANNVLYDARHDMMIDWLNRETETFGTDFLVFNGDLVTNRPHHLPVVKEQYDKLTSKYYVTHGNHDHSSEENWKNIWGYGRNHSFEFGKYAAILLNSADEEGNYMSANTDWLKNQLTLFVEKEGIIIFCHIDQHNRNPLSLSRDRRAAPGQYPDEEYKITTLMLETTNLKMVVYSHNHRMDGHMPVIQSARNGGRRVDTFYTGHFSAWGLPYFSYRVIEVYDDDMISTYVLDPENRIIKNWSLLPIDYSP